MAWLAEAAGVDASQISMLTRGIIKHPRIPTVKKIADALGVPAAELIGEMPDQLDWTDGTRPFEGVVSVPIVRLPLNRDGRAPFERAEAIVVPASLLRGRTRLLGAIIDGGGMSPHVLIGDRVVFDPDVVMQHGDLALVYMRGVTLAAWYVEHGSSAPPSYHLADGTWLEPATVEPIGVILSISRTPPMYRPPQTSPPPR